MNERIVYTASEINDQISQIFVDDKVFNLMGGYPQPINGNNGLFWSPAYGEDGCHYDLYWKRHIEPTHDNCEYFILDSYHQAVI